MHPQQYRDNGKIIGHDGLNILPISQYRYPYYEEYLKYLHDVEDDDDNDNDDREMMVTMKQDAHEDDDANDIADRTIMLMTTTTG